MAITAQTAGQTWYAKSRPKARKTRQGVSPWASKVIVRRPDGTVSTEQPYSGAEIGAILNTGAAKG
jgi:hypothetical protein